MVDEPSSEREAQNMIMVASDVGGHKELIRDGETGNLFRADDVEGLSATILRVLGNRDGWNTQRRAGAKVRRDRAHLGE